MEHLIFSLNAVAPIIILIVIGMVLRKLGITQDFWNVANKLVFKLFLPALLFYNVYNISTFADINWAFVLYAVVAIVVVFALAMVIVPLFEKDNARRGVIIQALFRSNYAIIGVPLATSLYGTQGASTASLLSAFIIPVFNLLSVVALSVYSNQKDDSASKSKAVLSVVKGIVTNPLILAVCGGLVVLGIRAVLQSANVQFRLFDFTLGGVQVTLVGNVVKNLANVATPLALLVLGGRFSFAESKSNGKTVAIVTLLRMVVLPVVAIVCAYLIVPSLQGVHFAVYISVFASPVAVASAVMAKEMHCDDKLAGQLVVWNTIVSGVTMFVFIAVMRAIGLI